MFAIPIIFPAMTLYGIEKMGKMPKRFGPQTSLQMFLFFCKLSIAVPLGTAFYPQHGKIDFKDVEESIKKLYSGKTPQYLLYNKGL